MRVLGASKAVLGSSSEGTGRSLIHDPLVEGSRGSAGKSTIHDPLVEGSRGILKTSSIHEGVTLLRGGCYKVMFILFNGVFSSQRYSAYDRWL